jgi:hypothetical protein
MPDNETPTTEELAEELAGIEGGDDAAPETAPDPEIIPDAPAEPEPEPAAPPPESPAADPEPEAEPTPEPREIAPPSSAQADKKAADGKRRKKAIETADRPAALADEDEEKRKADIQAKLAETQAELEDHLEGIEACRDRMRELMAELYPHTAESDKLVDSVRGHIAAQKELRKNRASNPARIAEILKQAGKAPIDAAFHRQRARGMSRPTRTPVKAKADEGEGSKANAGQE